MKLLAIAQFLIMMWGFGVGMLYLVRESKDPIERNIMRIGIGISGFLVFMVLINFLHIPLDWRVPLVVSLIGPGLMLFKRGFKFPTFRWSTETVFSLIVIGLFLVNFSMHLTGAFSYPYLEDTDPAVHGMGIKFISEEKGIHDQAILPFLPYIDPYPPGYGILMSTLFQVSQAMTWTLKFFNAVIVASGILFFFFLVKRFTGDNRVALGSAVVFTFIPSYLSHFIWAHSLVVTMLLVAFYCFLMIDTDKRWLIPAGIALCSAFYSQPSQALKGSVVIGIFIIGKMITSRSMKKEYWGAALLGGVLALFWFGSRVYGMIFLGKDELLEESVGSSGNGGLFTFLQNALPADSGTGTRVYSFADFFIATGQNMINNPIGHGITITLLVFTSLCILLYLIYEKLDYFTGWQKTVIQGLSIISAIPLSLLGIRYLFVIFGNPVLTSLRIDLFAYLSLTLLVATALALKPKRFRQHIWSGIVLAWLTFTYLGVNSLTFNLPIGLYAFRFWMQLAMPISILAGFAIARIMKKGFSPFLLPVVIFTIGFLLPLGIGPRIAIAIGGAAIALVLIFTRNIPLARYLSIAVIVMGIILTAGVPKYQVNTSQWPPDPGMRSMEEIETYNWLYTLPYDTRVYDLGSAMYTVTRDMYQCFWCDYAMELEDRVLNATADEIHAVLSEQDYEYAIIGGNAYKRLSGKFQTDDPDAEISALAQRLIDSPLFTVVQQGQGAIIFRVS